MKKFLILGYPRSGTSYTALAFHKIGVYVGHERDETNIEPRLGRACPVDGVVTGLFLGCSRDLSRYEIIMHQVRNPLDVLTSAQRMKHRSLCDLCQTCNIDVDTLPKSKLYRVMKTWLAFTEMADSVSSIRFRVEDLKANWHNIWRKLKPRLKVPFPQRMNTYVNTYGNWRPKQLRWENLFDVDYPMATEIQKRTREYGYNI